ncbi:uncharacterized protein LOC125841784 [Solanum stenotomum]|uniref:uncharacterized protein LOC125841784 n=1 Tax=Solanum stenotomum TaxID=172797 RepID=UPI0020D05527|nr:uncharacterized protein LOC125841784 [Solanum stenotomum]
MKRDFGELNAWMKSKRGEMRFENWEEKRHRYDGYWLMIQYRPQHYMGKTAFITPWGVYHYRVMPFGLKNASATYTRAMKTIFHDMIHKEIELNPAKCAFGVTAGKLLGFIVTIKAQALADHLAENPVDEEYKPLKNNFPDEEVAFVGDISEAYRGWKVFFDGAANHQGKCIGAVLVSESGQHYLMAAKLRFDCTNNMAEYDTCILGLKMAIDMNVHELLVIGDSNLLIHQVQREWAVKNPKITLYVQYIQKLCKTFCKIEFRHTPRTQNELADALASIASMIKHPDTSYIDPVDIEIKEQFVHCSYIEVEPDSLPWYFDIKKYLETGTYPENATFNQKKSIRRMTNNFFPSGEILYRRTPDLGLLRCVGTSESVKLMEQIHAGVCGTHMNGLTLAKKILRAGYFWMTMKHDCYNFVQNCHKCQVHGDLIQVPPRELNATSSPWPFVAWGMDVIGPIEFGVPESIITDNGANLNSHLIREICE